MNLSKTRKSVFYKGHIVLTVLYLLIFFNQLFGLTLRFTELFGWIGTFFVLHGLLFIISRLPIYIVGILAVLLGGFAFHAFSSADPGLGGIPMLFLGVLSILFSLLLIARFLELKPWKKIHN